MRRRPGLRRAVPALLCVLGLSMAACTSPGENADPDATAGSGSLLDTVKSRGTLRCGVNREVPGFGFPTADGAFAGFDIDFCKAIAAAVIGDANAVEYKPLSAAQRFPSLKTNDIDVLVRNTTATATRDGAEGATFATPTFYDGQGVMVKTSSSFRDLDDLRDTAICVLTGTTTELNLASQLGARGIKYEPRPFETVDTLKQAFLSGACDAWTSDLSQLAGQRSGWPADQGGPAALTVLSETLSKEPLAPAVLDGDPRWASAMDWVVQATIQAEEFKITQANVDQVRSSTTDPDVKRFLGVPLEANKPPFDPGLGLPVDFAYKVVKLVGNYGEIYARNVGPDTPLGLARGQNALWTDGGLHYALPYR